MRELIIAIIIAVLIFNIGCRILDFYDNYADNVEKKEMRNSLKRKEKTNVRDSREED